MEVLDFVGTLSDCGSGSGDSSGYGDGYGSGSGSGDGYGTAVDIKSISYANRVYEIFTIDDVPTIILCTHGNYAKGCIVHKDLTTTPCYIAKAENIFAHGTTLKEAQEALNEKLYKKMPVEERVSSFIENFKVGEQYPVLQFYEWHGRLTGSCKAGRDAFAKDHGIDLSGTMTVEEFIRLTEHAYGGEVIRQIAERL